MKGCAVVIDLVVGGIVLLILAGAARGTAKQLKEGGCAGCSGCKNQETCCKKEEDTI